MLFSLFRILFVGLFGEAEVPELKVSGTICVSRVSATWDGDPDPDAALDYVGTTHNVGTE